MIDQVLLGKSALVTGAVRRIGRYVALELARAGADVTITYRGSAAEAAEVVKQIEALGRRGQAVHCDIRKEADVKAAVAAMVAFHGRLDVLVNNAAIFQSTPLEALTLEDWDAVHETNVRGPFLMTREAIPHLRAVKGRVVNMGSLGGLQAWPQHAHYCSSKAAVHMLTRVMAKALAPEVSVNAIAPGWIAFETDQPDAAERSRAQTPMQRNGSAQDIADAVLYFVTHSGFVTGQILSVDGGLGV
ncbi:MAG: SDR family oxidoreductase [Acidobacteriota bacterium]|nr:SDR family oxidoreductase [Acidobacteriota bacterium]